MTADKCARCGESISDVAFFTDTYNPITKSSVVIYLCKVCQSGLIDVMDEYMESGKK